MLRIYALFELRFRFWLVNWSNKVEYIYQNLPYPSSLFKIRTCTPHYFYSTIIPKFELNFTSVFKIVMKDIGRKMSFISWHKIAILHFWSWFSHLSYPRSLFWQAFVLRSTDQNKDVSELWNASVVEIKELCYFKQRILLFIELFKVTIFQKTCCF